MQKTVLLVESDDQNVASFQNAFREAGCDGVMHILRSSGETIRFLAGDPPYDNRERYPVPTLLLLAIDIVRPGGADVLRWLQARGEIKKRLPIVVLSPVGSDQEMEAAYAWGANSYLVKPPAFPALVVLVRELSHYWLNLNRLPQLG